MSFPSRDIVEFGVIVVLTSGDGRNQIVKLKVYGHLYHTIFSLEVLLAYTELDEVMFLVLFKLSFFLGLSRHTPIYKPSQVPCLNRASFIAY